MKTGRLGGASAEPNSASCREGPFAGPGALCVTRDGSVVKWFGDNRGTALFARWDGDAFVRASSLLNDHGFDVHAVKQAPDGSIWAVGRGTILRWDYLPGAWTWHPDLPPPAFEDRQHRLWFADEQVAAVLSGAELRRVPGIHRPIFQDGRGVVWGAGADGVMRWSNGELEAVPESVTGIATLHGGTTDNEGIAWLRGMNRERAQSLAAETAAGWRVFGPSALGGRSIMSITADPQRGVWVVLNEDRSSVYEIVRVTADELRPAEIVGVKPQTHLPRLCGSRTRLRLHGYNGLWESSFGEKLSFTRVQAGAGGGFVSSASIGDVSVFLLQEGMDGNAAVLLARGDEWLWHRVDYGESMWLGKDGWLMVANGAQFVLWQTRLWNTPTYVSLPTETTINSIVRAESGDFWIGIREGAIHLLPGATRPDTLLDGSRTLHHGESLLVQAHGVAPFVPRSRTKRYSFAWRLDSGPWSGYGDWPASGISLEGCSPGNHLLEARARDGLGNEDPTPASFAFTILPTPIQDRPWFRPALAGFAGILATLSFALFRTTRRLRLYSGGLQALVQARTEELRQDIARREKAEEEKDKLQARLNQAQKMESIGRLAGGVAHDFNNMLQAILGNTALALEQVPPSHPLRNDLQEIQQAAQRSADLTRQLLAFARKQTIAPKVLNLNDTVASMLQMLRRLIGEGIELSWIPGRDLWSVKIDPSQFDQILANLCVNARDAIGDTGKVTIETSNLTLDDTYARSHPECAPGDYVLLAVSDTGKGMDEETRSHLFEPFFTTKQLGQGTGLGLATVFGIVKQHLGAISVYSEPGQGTTFKIYLPRAEAPPSRESPHPERASPRGTETVLLVEDENQILGLARRILERQGYTVLAARTPSAAIELAQRHSGSIHLLLTDVVMPEMNGREPQKRIAAFHPGLRCLFMSGYTANVIVHHGVLDEGVQFLQKPFTIESLAGRVRETLERPAEP